jgi:fructokinase
VIARVGRDIAGDELISDLKSLGMDPGFVEQDEQIFTSRIAELLDRTSGSHQFSFRCPSCQKRLPRNGMPTRSLTRQALEDMDDVEVFFFDRASDRILNLASEARKRGALIFFEPGKRMSGGVLQRAIELADIIKYSQRRLGTTVQVATAGPRLLIETLEDGGLRYRLPDVETQWETLSAFAVDKPVDTAGAGDWCTVGFLFKFIDSSRFARWTRTTIEHCLNFGQALAAMSTLFIGPLGYLRSTSPETIVALGEATLTTKSLTWPVGFGAQKDRRPNLELELYRSPPGNCPICLMEFASDRHVVSSREPNAIHFNDSFV